MSPNNGICKEMEFPTHSISISFDLDKSVLYGTSRIIVPKQTALTLQLGPLTETGCVLEPSGKTSLTLKPKSDNTLFIPPSKYRQTLTISWSLLQDQVHSPDNLISKNGITLAGFWHPLPDRDMIYNLSAELPAGFSGITEAETITIKKKQFLSASLNQPLRSIHFIAGPYEIKSSKVSERTTLFTYFFKEDKPLAENYLEKGGQYLKRYEEMIGPYPYQRFAIVENRLPTGYSMPTFTLLGQAVVRLPFIKDTSLGHEILHSWFGNGIRSGNDGNWVEGLTTYMADHLYSDDKGQDNDFRKNQLQRYMSYVGNDNKMRLMDFLSPVDNNTLLTRKNRAIGYDKCSMFFHMLSEKLGKKLFLQGLRRFYNRMLGKTATWRDIEETFSSISSQNLRPFFQQWLDRSDIPSLKLDNVNVRLKEGETILTFDLIQLTDNPYSLEIPVVIETTTDKIRKKINIDSLKNTLHLQIDGLVTSLSVDPEFDIMRRLTPDELGPSWSRFLGAEKKIVILPPESKQEQYKPFIGFLNELGVKFVKAEEIKNSDFKNGNYLFLGYTKPGATLFGRFDHEEQGCTIDIRENPLNQNEIIVLVSSSSADQCTPVVSKLNHYGKYNYLHFINGRINEKKEFKGAEGIQVEIIKKPEGTPTRNNLSFDEIITDLDQSRVIYVGENHADYGSHLLQLMVIQALYNLDPGMAIGMEMFPRSAQPVLDQYIDGKIKNEGEFIKKSGYFKVWGFDYRLYRDIIGFAHRYRIPIIGLNLDKEIVSTVYKEGNTDRADSEHASSIALERNLAMPGYRERLLRAHKVHKNSNDQQENFNGFLQSQVIWDETMAESITMYLQQNPDKKMVVLAGTGHVFKDNGIPPRVRRRLNVKQSIVLSADAFDPTTEKTSQFDYLFHVPPTELEPAGKIGVFLKEEKLDDKSKETQLRVMQISSHGNAGEAGMEVGDILIELDGQPIQTIEDLKISLIDKSPDEIVTVRILRTNLMSEEQKLTCKVKLSTLNPHSMPPNHPPRQQP